MVYGLYLNLSKFFSIEKDQKIIVLPFVVLVMIHLLLDHIISSLYYQCT